MTDNFSQHEPIGHYMLLIQKRAKEMTDSGIYIPEQARDNLTQGTVVKTGELVDLFDLGDEVVYIQHSEQYVMIDGIKYVLLEDSNVVLVKRVESNPNNPINVLMQHNDRLSFTDALELFRQGHEPIE